MITGIRIDKVEAWRERATEMKGLDINISVDTVKVTGPEVEVQFTYTATYPDKNGSIVMKGRMTDEPQKMLMSYLAEMAVQNSHVPESVNIVSWNVGAGTVEAEFGFVGHASSPATGKNVTIRFKAGLTTDDQRHVAMDIKEMLGAKGASAKVISIKTASLVGPDATMEVAPSPVGVLRMKGALLSHEDAKLAKDIATGWEADRKLPDAFSELVLNAINFTCGTNGVLVVRPVNLAPPMVPPRISLGNAPAGQQ